MFSESQFYFRKEQKLERKKDKNNNGLVCGVNQTDSGFVLNLRQCLYFKGQRGSGTEGVPTIIIIKKQ